VIFDLDWREVLWENVREYPELVWDAASYATVVVGGASEFIAAALDPRDLLKRGPKVVVVKRGADGASVIDARGSRDIPGLPVPVVNGLGAGDAFGAALGAALLQGIAPDDAVRRACAAGAIVASRLSCSTAMPKGSEIDALLRGGSVVDGAVVAS
jgi:5-dehydro-2-deoxygluconokinase